MTAAEPAALALLCTVDDWELCLAAMTRSGFSIESVDLVVVDGLQALPIRGLACSVTVHEDGTTRPHPLNHLKS